MQDCFVLRGRSRPPPPLGMQGVLHESKKTQPLVGFEEFNGLGQKIDNFLMEFNGLGQKIEEFLKAVGGDR